MDIKKVQSTDNSINSKGLKMDSKKTVSALETVQAAVQKLYTRAEREVPENLSFAPVREIIMNNLKEYHLKIIADPVDIKNSRRVILSTGIPETQYSASLSLTKGSKSEILKELSDDGFSKFVLDNIKELEKTSKSME